MDNKKIGRVIFYILVLLFFFTYFLGGSGFFEYKLSEKKYLTEEKIKEFEADLESGKEIDIKNYLDLEEKNYDNEITILNRKISSYVEKGFEKTLKYIFRYLES